MAAPSVALLWAVWRLLPEPDRDGQSWINLGDSELDVDPKCRAQRRFRQCGTGQGGQAQEMVHRAGAIRGTNNYKKVNPLTYIAARTKKMSYSAKPETRVSYEAIRNDVKVCMFDQYGTVVDMQGGLTAIAEPFLEQKGWTGDPNAFVTWWRRTHFENSMIDALLHREHTPYREIGRRAVAHVMDRAKINYTMDEVHYLIGEIEKLKPFPEVPDALARLQTRYRLVVLSNGDPDMLETARSYHKIPFDRVISVAEANSFKPYIATYTKAAELIKTPLDQILFVANHAFDCIGAKSAGMRTAFIDRRSRPFGMTPHQPDIVVPTMKDLADAIV